jgi:hypothetical protein
VSLCEKYLWGIGPGVRIWHQKVRSVSKLQFFRANTERCLGSKKKPSKQYEVIAIEDFEEEDFIGEYVGKVIYQKVTLPKTVITLYGNDI